MKSEGLTDCVRAAGCFKFVATETVQDGLPAEGTAGAKQFYHSVVEFVRDLPGTAKRFWVLVVVTGLLSGLSAVLLVKLMRLVQNIAWSTKAKEFLEAVASTSNTHRLLVCVIGGLVVTVASIIVGQPMKGHGTASIIESIWVKSGRMPLARTLLRGTVSIIAVALGAPLGREGALLQSGAATGSSLARRLRLPSDQARLLVACVASAGIAAAYNVPIGAALFGLEVLLGSFALELFGPIVLSCVVATLVSRLLISDHPSYVIPRYALSTPRELLLAVLCGPLLGVASAVYVRVINRFSSLVEKLPPIAATFMPVGAMALVGLGAIFFPQLLGNGYDSVNAALLSQMPLLLLLLLPLLKMFATALTAGAGVPGGLFTPSLFYGALLGAALGQLAHFVWPALAPTGAFALIGMAGVLAGTTHASVSAVLIIFELTGSYSVILPLMLSAVLSTFVSRKLQPESLYTSVLRRRNVLLPESQPNWLRSMSVRDLLDAKPRKVSPSTPFQELVVELLELPPGHDLYVVGAGDRLLGVVELDALKGHLPDHALLEMTIAADVMNTGIEPVRVDMSLSEVAARFASTTMEHFPVVDRAGRLVGTVSKGDVLRHGRF